ncbi:conserved hypothetical protein [Thiomonas arsenitoxydans]|uniref:Uncharacterized protein n=1 Tax=Thiomonas arsenitoxydans (strain DSM 22701 / CIP 110005 / 3As) TaxID=426114 RepID=D6CLC6_THIA3|nr:hypothetical protein [Thiomonas arsenitoxydans]CAZ89354.1 hypothetical protein THI_2741 [Thiomonas arsenitoxydans]CQR33872.1 conserved hypothetical protein [Thiomonas arsenitoxydans]CQR35550.1 conserved hypothetical protein [Thiomonas arsenitoxydans]CQR37782.1 conserved hypothetical protein [Thiomonas arsenitoxydans]CQR37925.1 conserved hypothetical protein [Thiomonas arsenitoxydans]
MSKNLETRLQRLERIARPRSAGAVDVLIFGVGRNDAGDWVEDAQPGIVLRIPAASEARHDAQP